MRAFTEPRAGGAIRSLIAYCVNSTALIFDSDFKLDISNFSCGLFLLMESRSKTGVTWTKQDGEDASRLLAGLDRRAKKAVEAVSSTQIQNPGAECPSDALGKTAGKASMGEALKPFPPVTVALGGDCDGPVSVGGETLSRWEIANDCGRRVCTIRVSSFDYANDNRLPHGQDIVRIRTREVYTLPVDW